MPFTVSNQQQHRPLCPCDCIQTCNHRMQRFHLIIWKLADDNDDAHGRLPQKRETPIVPQRTYFELPIYLSLPLSVLTLNALLGNPSPWCFIAFSSSVTRLPSLRVHPQASSTAATTTTITLLLWSYVIRLPVGRWHAYSPTAPPAVGEWVGKMRKKRYS